MSEYSQESRSEKTDNQESTPVVISLDLWSRRGGAYALVAAFSSTLPLYYLATFLDLTFIGFDIPPLLPIAALLLALITGIVAFYYAAKGWVKNIKMSLILLIFFLPAFAVTGLLCGALTSSINGISAGLLSFVSLLPLYLSSLWGNRIADRERIPRLASILRNQLKSGKTLDLEHISWLKETKDIYQFFWKL